MAPSPITGVNPNPLTNMFNTNTNKFFDSISAERKMRRAERTPEERYAEKIEQEFRKKLRLQNKQRKVLRQHLTLMTLREVAISKLSKYERRFLYLGYTVEEILGMVIPE